MNAVHKFFIYLLISIFMLQPLVITAAEDKYTVYDPQSGLSESFATYEEADRFYDENSGTYRDLILQDEDQVLKMNYGIVEFVSDEACEILLDYHSLSQDEDKSFGPCYAADGLYLQSDGEQVRFMLAGDIGTIAADKVILHPFAQLSVQPSYYLKKGDDLLHIIKTQFDIEYASFVTGSEDDLSELVEDTVYYSYDGHYFYDDFYALSDDVRAGNHEHSVNTDPYYPYFRYLPYRSLSSYTADDLQFYIEDILGIDKKPDHYEDYDGDMANDTVNASQLYGLQRNFIWSQELFGTNSLLLFSQALKESAYGKSFAAYTKNNLFKVSAFESEEEREKQRYQRVADSIYAFSRYIISGRIADHRRSDYSGTFFGDELSGMTSDYDEDPYFGEKCASLAYRTDKDLGSKDLDKQALAIIRDQKRLRFYSDEQLKDTAFILKDVRELSFVILAENEEAYKLQIDQSYDEDHFYDFEKAYAYIAKENVACVINEEQIGEYELEKYEYDLGDGDYHGFHKLTYRALYDEPVDPDRDGFLFAGYEDKQALYVPISRIETTGTFKGQDKDKALDFQGVSLRVFREDGQSFTLPLSYDQVDEYEAQEGNQELSLLFNGMRTMTDINVQDHSRTVEEMKEALENDDPHLVKEKISRYHEPLTMERIAEYDAILYEEDGRNYVIKDSQKERDISFSGFDLSLADRISFIYTNDTYYINVTDISPGAEERIMEVADGYGFTALEGVDLDLTFNYQDISLQGPALVTLYVPARNDDQLCSVYHLAENGDVLKCKSVYSDNYVTFLIKEEGSYQVLALDSINRISLPDQKGLVNKQTMGFDNHRVNIQLFAALFLALTGIAGITYYYLLETKDDNQWKDFRKSLR